MSILASNYFRGKVRKEPKQQVNVRLPAGLHDRIVVRAKALGLNIETAYADALSGWLGEGEGKPGENPLLAKAREILEGPDQNARNALIPNIEFFWSRMDRPEKD